MTNDQYWPDKAVAAHSLHTALMAFPISCFSLTVLTDLFYVQTLNLLWLHFSEWLLLAGLVFGGLALVVRLVDLLVRHVRPSGSSIIGAILVMILATLNSFIHTADGWTAVVPYGLAVSVLTVVVMIATGWLGRMGARHV